MTQRSLRRTLLAAAGLAALAGSPASAQYMAAAIPTGIGIGTDQLFVPWGANDYGRLYVNPLNDKLLAVADLSYWPQFSPSSAPSPFPYYVRNTLFDWPAQYKVDCGDGIWVILNKSRLCRATDVPVVAADRKDAFLGQLSAAGFKYSLVYPIADNGNGRGYVVWTSMEGLNSGTVAGLNMPLYGGYARIEGIGWRDQFQSMNMGGVYRQHGDTAGDFIAGLASPRRETTLRLVMPMMSSTIGTNVYGVNATMVTDDWLGQTTPPPPPPPPPLSVPLAPPPAPPPAGSANPTNSGGPGAASGTGTGSTAVHDEQGAAFQWEAYCRSPNPDGSKRPSGWIDNCLATRH